MEDEKKFSIRKRISSVTYAWRGLCLFFKNTHNAWVQVFFGLLVVYLGFLLNISSTEWALIILSIGLVFVAEAFNTAIEIDIDLTSPEYHPYARDTKDVAAGAVLIMSTIALIIGLIIFLPKILLNVKI